MKWDSDGSDIQIDPDEKLKGDCNREQYFHKKVSLLEKGRLTEWTFKLSFGKRAGLFRALLSNILTKQDELEFILFKVNFVIKIDGIFTNSFVYVQ